MFHMITCFNLEQNVTIEEFRSALDRFSAQLVDADLLLSTGPIGRRQRHPIMDTDDERNHEYYFTMTFRDRDQCDRAVAHIQPGTSTENAVHNVVLAAVSDPVFTCWEDLSP